MSIAVRYYTESHNTEKLCKAAAIEGELYLKGKIRLGYIARIVLNINIWKTIKAARKIKV